MLLYVNKVFIMYFYFQKLFSTKAILIFFFIPAGRASISIVPIPLFATGVLISDPATKAGENRHDKNGSFLLLPEYCRLKRRSRSGRI